MKIGIVGPGRLGSSLAHLLSHTTHQVTTFTRDDLEGRGACEVLLLTVPDSEIAAAARASARGPVVLHCSGATPVDVLRPHEPAGSLHPLMTFPGPELGPPDLTGVPAAVAGDPRAVDIATSLATDLGLRPFSVPGDRRLYHAAAVMAGNFATVLLADSATTLAAAGVPEDQAAGLLLPLALASLQNAGKKPVSALTGPAVRGDHGTIARHRQALAEAGLDEIDVIYAALTHRAAELSHPDRDG